MNRRDFLKGVFGSAAVAVAGPLLSVQADPVRFKPNSAQRMFLAMDDGVADSDYSAWYYIQLNNVPMIVTQPRRSLRCDF